MAKKNHNPKGAVQSTDEVLFYFDGKDIAVDTLIDSLGTFKKVCEEVMEKAEPDKKLALTIRGVDRGSVIIDYGIAIIDGVKQIKAFAPGLVSDAEHFVKAVSTIYKVAAWLKGKKAKKVIQKKGKKEPTTVKIKNNNGQVQNFDLRGATIYLQNSDLQQAIAQNFGTMEDDERIKGFEVRNRDGKPLTRVDRSEFRDISRRDIEEHEDADDKNHKTETIETKLPIKGQDWEMKKVWEFYLNGIKISAKIKDDVFKKKIEDGEAFAKGDSLVVDLEIKKEYNEAVGVWVNKSYSIVKVKEHIKREKAEQGKLDFEGKAARKKPSKKK